MRLIKLTNIDFMGQRKRWYIFSAGWILAGVIAVLIKGIALGIDFLGGTELLVRFSAPVPIAEVRSAMAAAKFEGTEIKVFGSPNDILIRTAEQAEGSVVGDRIREALRQSFPSNVPEVLREDKIGPKIGAELRRDAVYAVIGTLVIMLVYVGFRFKFIYGVSAVIALFHDVAVTLGIVVLVDGLTPKLNLEMSQTMMAAFLTLIGYSINDKVVVFDRIRENLKIHKGETLFNLLNRSINETLSRTIITGGAVLLVLIVLIVFGGEVNRAFAFTFLLGTLIGTYSSIFVASSIVLDWSLRGGANKQ
jgi:preprotein translocase SecF subunit